MQPTYRIRLSAALAALALVHSATMEAATNAPYAAAYDKYVPDFLNLIQTQSGWGGPLRDLNIGGEALKLSEERSFYTLALIEGSDRVNALIAAAAERCGTGNHRDALEIYQKIVDEFPEALYRVSPYGVFVPAASFAQLSILNMPQDALEFYRSKYDARARNSFEQASRKNSLGILANLRDTALATSYGARSLVTLGDAALDKGHFLEALEYYQTLRSHFPDPDLVTPIFLLKMAYCRKMLGDKDQSGLLEASDDRPEGKSEVARQLRETIKAATPDLKPTYEMLASAPHVGTDDYAALPPTQDGMALKTPVWSVDLDGARRDTQVFSDPVCAGRSFFYRHKNIVYCRSILNGELRWKNDVGGRAGWQNGGQRRFPHEQLLIRDGLVVTPIRKIGPSLVALDQVTGQIRWVYGPMAAANEEEASMRFEAVPAGGPNAIYAGYVLDNIQGNTHVATEYGLIALESGTGRVLWRRPLSVLRPGTFSDGFAVRLRNRVRSFFSPPLYHEGTVYYCTNAGTVAAVDAFSGQIKWLMRYPYYPAIHDMVKPVNYPTLWYPQRPFLDGDRLVILPVNTRLMLCLDRRTGKVLWSSPKGSMTKGRNKQLDEGTQAYLVGATKTGELVFAFGDRWCPATLIDPATGKTVWHCPPLLSNATEPVLKYGTPDSGYSQPTSMGYNGWRHRLHARPFLTTDDHLYVTHWEWKGWPVHDWATFQGAVDLRNRKRISERRYINHIILEACRRARDIFAPSLLKQYESVPVQDDKIKALIPQVKEIIEAPVPENEHPSFLPFSRLTFTRYGVPFELRFAPNSVSMLYDRAAFRDQLRKDQSSEALFMQAELALGASRNAEAVRLMQQCLVAADPDDVAFRTAVNQQLYQVHRRLARSALQAGSPSGELEHCLGMSRSVGTLSDEIESRFALAEAFARGNEFGKAAAHLQSIVGFYGQYEFPLPSVFSSDIDTLLALSRTIIDRQDRYVRNVTIEAPMRRAYELMKAGLPVYFGALTPLDKDLAMRAGDLAVRKLRTLQQQSESFRDAFEKQAEAAFEKHGEARLEQLSQFPGTKAGAAALHRMCHTAIQELDAKDTDQVRRALLRRNLWELADAARLGGFALASNVAERVLAPPVDLRTIGLTLPFETFDKDLEDERSTAWMILERNGQRLREAHRLFMGGRVKTRVDHKFMLWCLDGRNGKVIWKATEPRVGQWFEEIRLKDKGEEPGFRQAFVHGDLVVTHGLYDVLAFDLRAGKLRWRYEVPFGFDIREAMLTGDLLVLSGGTETVALYVPTDDARGEVAWEAQEAGELYDTPFLAGDRLVSVRKLPFNVTVRYRSTGRLIGRLDMPSLSINTEHPLLENGPAALPMAHHGSLLALTDGYYYLMVDVERMKTIWKRIADRNDPTSEPAMRFALSDKYFAIVKKDFDVKSIYMLSSRTGKILWHTDPKDAKSPQPIYQLRFDGDRLYGIGLHPGQGFYLEALDAATGKRHYRQSVDGYVGKPTAELLERRFGDHIVARVKDRQDFELRAFNAATGVCDAILKVKGVGEFGEPGRASATVQNGNLALLGRQNLKLAFGKQAK